jgi:predicted Rossmann fold flavoprotein
MDLNTRVIVVGSGPAGLMAALTAAGQGASVTVLESLPSPGRKLLASGAGKCNFTNMLTAEAMAERFVPEQRRFVKPALMNFSPEMCRKFFRDNGVKYKLVDDFYCFPESEKAFDILNVFLRKFEEYNVKTVCNAPVSEFLLKDGRINGVIAGNNEYSCDYLIAAGGGSGFPALGGRGLLDKVCAQANVEVVKRRPALCGIKSQDSWLQDLGGIVLDKAEIKLDKNNYSTGTLLFTGDGISGPAALDMAGRAAVLLDNKQKVVLKINPCPSLSTADWQQKIDTARKTNGKKLIRNILSGTLPQALLGKLTDYAGVTDVTAAQLGREMQMRLLEALTNIPCQVSRVENLDKAMATTGGVSRNEVNAKTMNCKKIENLYFAGEFIDVDGPCGGYNIQWALSSGYTAGLLKSQKSKS